MQELVTGTGLQQEAGALGVFQNWKYRHKHCEFSQNPTFGAKSHFYSGLGAGFSTFPSN